jgi:hypothetical protein
MFVPTPDDGRAVNRNLSGTTTIEGLVALTILTAGILGAVGTVAINLRAAHHSDLTSRGVRLAGEVMARIRSGIDRAGGVCASLSAGTLESTAGVSVRWSLLPERGGRAVLMEISYPSAGGRSQDSLWSFVRCF